MRYLRLYNEDSVFKTHEQEAGGTGNDIQSIVPGIVKTLDERKMYFNPHDKGIQFHTLTINYKNRSGESLAPSTTKSIKYIPGVEQEIVVTPKNIEDYIPLEDRKIVIIPTENTVDFVYDVDLALPLTFEIISGGTIYWKKSNSAVAEKEISYRINDGRWQKITSNSTGTPIEVSANDIVQFIGDNSSYSCYHYSNYFSCSSNLKFNAKGNIMSLIDSVNYSTLKTLPNVVDYQFAFPGLFEKCDGLVSAQKLALPATALSTSCYTAMFSECTSLTTPPSILPATTLADECYRYMFHGCSSLTTAPSLPATSLKYECYRGMFSDCSSLVIAPDLPATTLNTGCYYEMFRNCTSLTKSPLLSATDLSAAYSYYYAEMFKGCSSLSFIECLATKMPGSYSLSTSNWVQNVSDFGIFLKSPDITEEKWGRGVNRIPLNWVVGNYGETFVLDKTVLNVFETKNNSETIRIIGLTDNVWTASTNNQWITLDVVTGASGITDITVSVPASTGARNGSITFTDGITTKTLPVIQNEYEKYKSLQLTFNIISSGTIYIKSTSTQYTVTLKYKKNDNDWVTVTSNTGLSAPAIQVNSGDVLKFIGNNTLFSIESYYYNYFSASTGTKFDAYGNIFSVQSETNFLTLSAITRDNVFTKMFYNCAGLVSAENLILPATVISGAQSCYSAMFSGCTSLITAPSILPATALSPTCYDEMFIGCTSLTKTPELPATSFRSANHCYRNMFKGCTSLTTAPSLPATTLGYSCYMYMFQNCTSLVKAPTLPATALTEYCYAGMFSGCTSLTIGPSSIGTTATTVPASACTGMFSGCTSLTSAPVLPAYTLSNYCYAGMFAGCTSLNYIKCLAKALTFDCTSYWVNGVSSSGTFVKNPSMSSWTTGYDGIPSGWTVQDA